MTQTMAALKHSFTREGILLCFNGPFSHEIIEELGRALKMHLGREEIAHAVLMDVFAVFVEQMQNIRNYTQRMPLRANPLVDAQSAIVIIGKQQQKYWVHSGNYIAREDLPPLIARLDDLNAQDTDALRRMYKAQLRQELPPDATGAGLGLIDMARRMSEPFQYGSERVNDDYDFFSLRVTLSQ